MLEFTSAQMAAAQAEAEEAFVARVAASVRRDYPEEVGDLTDPQLHGFVRNGVARARAHGFTTERGLAAWVFAMFAIAPNFDAHPAVRPLLDDQRRPEGERVTAVFQLPLATYQAVQAAYDEAAWAGT